jgi:hypothetical protein
MDSRETGADWDELALQIWAVQSAPNPYEASFCHETNCPCARSCCMLFRRMNAGAVGSRSRVLT